MEIEEGSVVYLLVRKTYAICTKFGKFFKDIDSLMTIFVLEDGMDSIEFVVHPWSFVNHLKHDIEKETGVPIESQSLSFNGTDLEDMKHLCNYNVKEGSVLTLVVSNEAK